MVNVGLVSYVVECWFVIFCRFFFMFYWVKLFVFCVLLWGLFLCIFVCVYLDKVYSSLYLVLLVVGLICYVYENFCLLIVDNWLMISWECVWYWVGVFVLLGVEEW